MAYLAPIHRPSSVRHALKLKLLSAEAECLVVAKSNRLEIYEQTVQGLLLKHVRAIYGKITFLQKLRVADSEIEHLFVGTDRHTYFSLSWNTQAKRFQTEKSYSDQSDNVGRDSQSAERCLVDPLERYMMLELFEGILTVIPLTRKGKKKADPETRILGEPIPVRVAELFIRSSAFLYPRGNPSVKTKPKLAILYEDNQQKTRLKIKSLAFTPGGSGESGVSDFEDEENISEEPNISASHIIPVPAPAFGFIILAETSVTYINDLSKATKIKPLEEATIFVAWERVDSKRWLLADDFGKLYLLMTMVGGDDDDEIVDFRLDCLGITSRASVLTYLDGGYVFVGSHQGDSQVVRIQEKALEVVQILPNIAPILDFAVMDMGSRAGEGQTNEFSSGQARIVTGSGAFQDGSLRSIRSGVGLEDLGSLGDMEGISSLFSLQTISEKPFATVLVASFMDETRFFSFAADGEVEEVESFSGFKTSEGTILASNVAQNRLLQCTPSFVRIVDAENGMVVGEWAPTQGTTIVAASTNGNRLVLSIGGVEAVVLDLLSELKVLARKNFGPDNQISCIDVPSIVPDIFVLGFWQSASVSIFSLETLENMCTSQINEESTAVPRSVLLTQILPDHVPTLFVAMADGNVVTFDVDIPNARLFGKKSTILGTQQANFRALPRADGLFNVFATCEHPSLIYGFEERIIFSAVTADKASCVCPFNAEAYPGAIAIATPEELKIALVDTQRTTHVQTLPIGDTVRRIAYSTNLRAFGLGTIQRTLKDGVEIIRSHFKLADEVVFKELDTYPLNKDELVESVLRADLKEGTRGLAERFIVGTAYIDEEDTGPLRGRIIIFEVTRDRMLKVVTEHKVLGACRALEILDGKIVAALVKSVVIFGFEHGKLQRIASYRTSTAPIDVAVTGDTIAVADLMKSVTIVQYRPGVDGEQGALVEIARHFQIAWTTAIANIEDNTYLESDAEGNLMVLRRNTSGVTEDDRRRLEVTSEIQLGEMVNRIREINVPTSTELAVIPKAFMATVDGSIYLFALIRPEKQDLLMRLQSNMAMFVESPGEISFNRYRAFKSSVREQDEPFRFVDGELIEKFLESSPEMQRRIVEGLNVEVEDIRVIVEGLRRLH